MNLEQRVQKRIAQNKLPLNDAEIRNIKKFAKEYGVSHVPYPVMIGWGSEAVDEYYGV